MDQDLSMISSLHDDSKPDDYVEPHYKECYRLAIDALADGGVSAYQEFLKKEGTAEFLCDAEISHITKGVEKPNPVTISDCEDHHDETSSSGTYWPVESDTEAPNLDLGWPLMQPGLSNKTNIDIYFHPPRGTSPTIKEVVRKLIKDARQVIGIVMDIFTDVDIFKDIVEASTRGIPVYLLLDHSNFSCFQNMAEKQAVQVQRLRNMRVRTVKGTEYLCRSGAKFHGNMSQTFLLVDCHTVLFGKYSFMWSFEKINLSMVQHVTGQLVESFDEEFRTLYARSQIPEIYAQEEFGSMTSLNKVWENSSYKGSVPSFLSSTSNRNIFDRAERSRHSLDAVYLQTRTRQQPNLQNHLGEGENFGTSAFNTKPPSGPNIRAKILQLQNSETTANWKRHSYAGEKPETSQYLLSNRIANLRANTRLQNWNTDMDSSSVASSGRGDYLSSINDPRQNIANRYTKLTQLPSRTSTLRSSFHGTDNNIRNIQQKMPTLERTTKTFLRNWRIESYLKDNLEYTPDLSGEVYENDLNGIEHSINPIYPHSRLRSSIVLQSTLTEHREPGHYPNSSSSTDTSQDSQSTTTIRNSNHMNTRFTSDSYLPSANTMTRYQPPLTEKSYGYSSLPRNTIRQTDQYKMQQADTFRQTQSSLKFYNDSKVYAENNGPKVVSSFLYGTAGRNTTSQTDRLSSSQDDSYGTRLHGLQHLNGPQLNHDQHLKNEWPYATGNATLNDLSTRTVSHSSLINDSKEEHNNQLSFNKDHKQNSTSPRFLQRGSLKIRSLLNLSSDKKENLSRSKSSFYKMCSSSDTLTSDDGDKQKSKTKSKKMLSSNNSQSSQSNSQCSVSSQKNVQTSAYTSLMQSTYNSASKETSSEVVGNQSGPIQEDSSAPRFNTEPTQYQEYKQNNQDSPPKGGNLGEDQSGIINQKLENVHTSQDGIARSRFSDKRVYSRFEPFCTMEHAPQRSSFVGATSTQPSDLATRAQANDYSRYNSSMPRTSQGGYQGYHPHSENRFGRFMQKVGNLINKK
ncbi:protein FAM83B [Protopterus annectens]|uniref:protein FAM83B n=1 Tax=Protopterus annectens TaxID=7888 RepID=UPI001CF9E172|nr:protein FAM83B [Protopterus annectens]